MTEKAVVLFSGGIDSTVALAIAIDRGRDCSLLSFDYGQRHVVELSAAKHIATHYNTPHKILNIDLSFLKDTSLINKNEKVTKGRSISEIANGGIPNTYVPARNTLFISFALSYAETIHATEIYVGFNALDYLPYPDCRPEFVSAFQNVINLGTKQGIIGKAPQLVSPLIHWDKVDIIRRGRELNAPLELTFSCYDPIGEKPCNCCDACILRLQGLRGQ